LIYAFSTYFVILIVPKIVNFPYSSLTTVYFDESVQHLIGQPLDLLNFLLVRMPFLHIVVPIFSEGNLAQLHDQDEHCLRFAVVIDRTLVANWDFIVQELIYQL
jgi:hypothetical protein